MKGERPRYQQLLVQHEHLLVQHEHLLAQHEQLRAQHEQLRAECERLRGEKQRREQEWQEEKGQLQSHIKALEDQVGELQRVVNRQVAPFRRREKQKKAAGEKKRPGRKPGHEGYFRRRPAQVDETIEVPLACCPHCQAALENIREIEQFIEEIPVMQRRRTRLVTYEGECRQHGRVRSTHPLQTSAAEGAAGTHLGPRAQAVAVALSHQTRLPGND